MNRFDARRYTLQVQRREIEGDLFFVGSVREFPDVEVYEESFAAAYDALVEIIESLKLVADENGRGFPVPLEPHASFSGRVTLRMPKSVHADAAHVAMTEGVSFNHWLISVISGAVAAALNKQKTSLHYVMWDAPSFVPRPRSALATKVFDVTKMRMGSVSRESEYSRQTPPHKVKVLAKELAIPTAVPDARTRKVS